MFLATYLLATQSQFTIDTDSLEKAYPESFIHDLNAGHLASQFQSVILVARDRQGKPVVTITAPGDSALNSYAKNPNTLGFDLSKEKLFISAIQSRQGEQPLSRRLVETSQLLKTSNKEVFRQSGDLYSSLPHVGESACISEESPKPFYGMRQADINNPNYSHSVMVRGFVDLPKRYVVFMTDKSYLSNNHSANYDLIQAVAGRVTAYYLGLEVVETKTVMIKDKETTALTFQDYPHTMVSLNKVAEDHELEWTYSPQSASITINGPATVKLHLGSKRWTLDGEAHQSQSPVAIYDKQFYVDQSTLSKILEASSATTPVSP